MKSCYREPLQRVSPHRGEDSSGNGSTPTTDISSSFSHHHDHQSKLRGGIFLQDSSYCLVMLLGARTSCTGRSTLRAVPAPGWLATIGAPCPARPAQRVLCLRPCDALSKTTGKRDLNQLAHSDVWKN